MSLAAAVLCLLAAGCMGWRDHHDPAADRYPGALGAGPPPQRGARVTVNVARFVAGRLDEPVSAPHPQIEGLARRTVREAGFRPVEGGGEVARRFLFDVRIDVTHEPGLLSGLILPFYRTRQVTAQLQVLDGQGRPAVDHTASAASCEARHLLLLPLTPFCRPGPADREATESVFEALSVKLLDNRDPLR